MHHFCLLPRPLLSPALPVVHSSGWEWTSQLAPLKETHISGCSPFPSVIFPSIETWPLSVHWLNISLSPSLFIPALQVRKGLSGYSSHYWLLNLVMVVKALPVPPCLRGQLMACFMSLQSRASLLGLRFILAPSPSASRPRGSTGVWAGSRPPSICSASAGLTRAAEKEPYSSSEAGEALCDLRLQIIWSEQTCAAPAVKATVIIVDGKSNPVNLWHISRNCHFLQSHKRESELLALVSGAALPCRLSEWNSPDYHSVSKSEWHQFLFDLFKGLCRLISIVIWD